MTRQPRGKVMRHMQEILVAGLVLLAGWHTAFAGDADSKLLAQITRRAKTDGERARLLLEAAKSTTDDRQLQKQLLGEAYSFGFRAVRGEAGYRAAEEAMLLLARSDPGQAKACRQKLRNLYDRRYRTDSVVAFDAAWKLMALDIEDGDRAAATGCWRNALKHYRHAEKVIRDKRLTTDVEVPVKIRSIEHRLDALRGRDVLQRRVAGGDDSARKTLVLLYVRELDDPSRAAELLEPPLDEALRTYVPLAARDSAKVPEAACLELARWYASLAANGSQISRSVCLLRARGYFQRFLAVHDRGDRARLEAQAGLAQAEDTLRTFRAPNVAAAWLLEGRNWRTFLRTARSLLTGGLGALPLEADARGAMQRGAAFLLSCQQADGSWPARDGFPAGPTALAACALLQSGLHAGDPRMIWALDWLAKQRTCKTYTLGLRCNVWMLAERQLLGERRKKYLKQLGDDAGLLVSSTSDGSYGYDCKGDGRSRGCNSNSQFALWGVYCAERALGSPDNGVLRIFWAAVLKHWLVCRKADGGWAYSGNAAPSATMTAAGLSSVCTCLDRMEVVPNKSKAAARSAAAKAAEWLEERFAKVTEDGRHLGNGDLYYFLYAVARAQTIRGLSRLGKIDWYEQGKEALLSKQASDGSWKGKHGKLVATSFALLFLTQGRRTSGCIAPHRRD